MAASKLASALSVKYYPSISSLGRLGNPTQKKFVDLLDRLLYERYNQQTSDDLLSPAPSLSPTIDMNFTASFTSLKHGKAAECSERVLGYCRYEE
jgi:hypothetical protein